MNVRRTTVSNILLAVKEKWPWCKWIFTIFVTRKNARDRGFATSAFLGKSCNQSIWHRTLTFLRQANKMQRGAFYLSTKLSQHCIVRCRDLAYMREVNEDTLGFVGAVHKCNTPSLRQKWPTLKWQGVRNFGFSWLVVQSIDLAQSTNIFQGRPIMQRGAFYLSTKLSLDCIVRCWDLAYMREVNEDTVGFVRAVNKCQHIFP